MSDSAAQAETKQGCGTCGCSGAGPVFTEFLRQVMPSGPAREHFEQAHLSFLKGVRAMLDARIEHLSKPDSKGTRINVE